MRVVSELDEESSSQVLRQCKKTFLLRVKSETKLFYEVV